ncbi:hypothetical protein [Prosthecomicrobium sp. N25]|uniref:hypothetical protein n=1 Tax=Prosthecomicrobium sp. N25 TaxID=3129254 RepID=UPI003077D8BF
MRRLFQVVLGAIVGFVLATLINAGLLYYRAGWATPVPHQHIAYVSQALGAAQDRIDFSGINDGEWSWLCLFGGGTQPILFMRTEAARRGESVEIPSEVGRLFFNGEKEPGALGPDDGALSVVDPLGNLSMVRFTGLPPIAGLKGPVCTDRKNPVVSLGGA